MAVAIVGGALANKPFNGGEAWVRLNWVLGLRKLGLDAYFVEQIDARTCVDAAGASCPFEASVNLAYFREITEAFGLDGSSALVCDGGEQCHGLSYKDLSELADSAELLVNISGNLSLDLFLGCRRKAYIDLDPGYTQVWHESGALGPALSRHDAHYTVGANVGTPACPLPTGGFRWRPIRQPVVMEQWPLTPACATDRFTTIATWRCGYGSLSYNGQTFGTKAREFRKFVEQPRRTVGSYEIALDIHPADQRDRDVLLAHGWRLLNPKVTAPDPDAFRRYVQDSAAEFSVAQGVYIETDSGWFSDRSARYLASGKPVLIQETGFSRTLPSGEGVVAFKTPTEAVQGAERILTGYRGQCAAARAIAEEFFDSDKVLAPLVDDLGLAP